DENQEYVIREGCRSIGSAIDQEVNLLASNLGILSVIPYELRGPNFTLERLEEVIDYEMSYQERDIIILVYVGHGFREPYAADPYPNLYFGSYEHSVNFRDIEERIHEKSPSILMNIVVACNVEITDHSVPPPYEGDNTPPSVVTLKGSKRLPQVYEGLFAEEPNMTKVVNLFSAEPNYYTFIGSDGGIFFNEILYTFREVLGGKLYGSWQEVCQTIRQRTTLRSENKGMKQLPMCSYVSRFNPVTVPLPPERRWLQPSACELAAKDLRRTQREQLRDLRRLHRDRMREARRNGQPRAERKLLAQQQRVEYENRKLRQVQAYQRQLLACR
ncbi:MAG: hypothetical protein AAGJ82_08905, partial [Bacteroidota bacterium]